MRLKDYYKILGIQPSADQQQIKKAYRALAFKYHPDTNPDNQYAEAQFKEIQEAYATLSHPNRRKAYDEERWLSGMSNRMQDQQAITPSWILHEAQKLERHMATIDTYRMSHSSLRDYVLLILSDAHLGILQKESNMETNTAITTAILNATKKLELPYAQEIAQKLYQLSAGNEEINSLINTSLENHKKQAGWQKLFPWLIVTITVLLCIFMWLYGRK